MVDAVPPDLPGYDHLRALGHGGFADVFLYRQHLPSREVAVKVLREPAPTADDREQFENETNRMAMLSSHPGIVTIYEVGVAPDGRPFLTMEFCPNDHFGSIARAHPLTVARALDVGIKVAAAVETAHRASILHRDIKPANILLTAYGEPALTDFGIAGGDGDVTGGDEPSQGVSIPFAAPEVLNGSTTGDQRSDVYSLGATIYALLAGRSPFSTGAPSTDAELVQRILHAPLPPTGRSDLPASLERVLATALQREPANRFESAAELGRALQGVEAELGLAQTPLRIADSTATTPVARRADDDDSTRFRALQRVDPDGPPAVPAPPDLPPGPPPPGSTPGSTGWTADVTPAAAPGDLGLGDRTVHRGAASTPPPPPMPATPEPTPRRSRRALIAAVAGGFVILATVVLLLIQAGGGGSDDDPTTTVPNTEPLVLGKGLARPEQVRITPIEGGGQRVTWKAPDAAEGDRYQVVFTDGPSDLRETADIVDERELEVETDEDVCLFVQAIRDGTVSDESTEVCTR